MAAPELAAVPGVGVLVEFAVAGGVQALV